MTRELEVAATKVKLAEATMIHVIASQACYDLFRQLLVDDPRDQWDHIVWEVHDTDPWTVLDGLKIRGLRMKTSKSLEDCITFQKRTVFSVDAAERLDVAKWVDAAMLEMKGEGQIIRNAWKRHDFEWFIDDAIDDAPVEQVVGLNAEDGAEGAL